MSIPAPYQFSPLPQSEGKHADSDLLIYACQSAHLCGELDASKLLASEEHQVVDKRKKQQAKDEYLVSRWLIKRAAKRLFPALSTVLESTLITRFDDLQKRLVIEHAGRQLPCSVCISHSKGRVLVAVSANTAPFGLDLEKIDPDRPLEKLARHFYHNDEADAISLHGADAFFRIWTLKEALAKATARPIAQLLSLRALDEVENAGLKVWSCQHQGFDITLMGTIKQPLLVEVRAI